MNDALGRAGEVLLAFNPLLDHVVKFWEKTNSPQAIRLSVRADGYVEISSSGTTEEAVVILARSLGVALATLSIAERNFAMNLPESQKKVLGFG